MRVSRTVVCPAKAGVFSRSQSCRGKSQKPRSLDGRQEGNRMSEAHRQRLPWGDRASHRAVTRVNAQVAPKVSSPGGRARNREGEGSTDRRNLTDAATRSGGVVATAR